VIFNSTTCQFQDQGMGKMIGLAKEDNGLQLLEDANMMCGTKSQISLSLLSETTLSNKEKFWLYHLPLGYPSLSALEILFPNLFQKVDIQMFHCDTCEFARHKHVNLPSSNERMVVPFALIRSDVWAPSSIPNLSWAHWFVIFIDNCTRVSWVFLFKQKSEVNQVFINFIENG